MRGGVKRLPATWTMIASRHRAITPAAVAELRLAPGQPVWLTAKATEVIAYADPGRT